MSNRVIKNVSWALAGKVVNLLAALFVGILVARYLGPESFGVMNYVIAYVMLFSVLSNFGLENIEIREMAKHEDAVDTILGTAFLLRLAISTLTILLIGGTLLVFESDRQVSLMVIAYAFSLLLCSFNVIRNYFTSIVLNEYVVKTEMVRTLFGAGIKILLLWIKAPLEWFIYAVTFDFVLVASGYIVSYERYRGSIFAWRFSSAWARRLVVESFPFLISGTIIAIYQRVDQVMIRNMLDAEQLGLFAVAGKIVDLGIFLPMVICQTVTPILVRKRRDDPEAYLELRQKFLDLLTWGSALVSLLVSISAAWMLPLLFGSQYEAAVPVLQVLAWKILFVAMFNMVGHLILIEEIQQWAYLRNLAGLATCVLANWILIPYLGIIGSAIAAIMTYIVSGLLAHALIPSYCFLFLMQLGAVMIGWKTLFNCKTLFSICSRRREE